MGKREELRDLEAGKGVPFEGAANEWRRVDGRGWKSCGLGRGAGGGVKGTTKEGMVAVGAGRRWGVDAAPPGFGGIAGGWLWLQGRWVEFQAAARGGPFGGEVGPGIEAVMADADEAFGEDVKQEATEEFVGMEGQVSFPGEGVAIPDGEGDGGRGKGDKAVV